MKLNGSHRLHSGWFHEADLWKCLGRASAAQGCCFSKTSLLNGTGRLSLAERYQFYKFTLENVLFPSHGARASFLEANSTGASHEAVAETDHKDLTIHWEHQRLKDITPTSRTFVTMKNP